MKNLPRFLNTCIRIFCIVIWILLIIYMLSFLFSDVTWIVWFRRHYLYFQLPVVIADLFLLVLNEVLYRLKLREMDRKFAEEHDIPFNEFHKMTKELDKLYHGDYDLLISDLKEIERQDKLESLYPHDKKD